MHYRAVGDRCAVDFTSLNLPIPAEEALALLLNKGFSIITVDLVALARSRIGISQYRRGARLREAPDVFDCSSFTKWLYAQRGIWIPRRSIQQRAHEGIDVAVPDIAAGDIIFTSGFVDYFIDDPTTGIGHVGIATNERTVVHAANRRAGVIESSLVSFIADGKLRGVRRFIPRDSDIITLIEPEGREVESSDDIRWIILQSLPLPPLAPS